MEQNSWKVTYRNRDGAVAEKFVEWSRKPTDHDAAILLRDTLLPSGFLLPDMERNSTESAAVHLLRSYGYEILAIDEVAEE